LVAPDNLHVTPTTIDDARLLEPSRRQVDRRALHAEHLRQSVLREGNVEAVTAVENFEQRPRDACLYRMSALYSAV
jgi:hypothetical protein